MNYREQQLREQDVRKFAPNMNPSEFLRRYLVSNFPQTAAIPSREQKETVMPIYSEQNDLKFKQKPLSGIQYDKPGVT
jgi:hypothetical protein